MENFNLWIPLRGTSRDGGDGDVVEDTTGFSHLLPYGCIFQEEDGVETCASSVAYLPWKTVYLIALPSLGWLSTSSTVRVGKLSSGEVSWIWLSSRQPRRGHLRQRHGSVTFSSLQGLIECLPAWTTWILFVLFKTIRPHLPSVLKFEANAITCSDNHIRIRHRKATFVSTIPRPPLVHQYIAHLQQSNHHHQPISVGTCCHPNCRHFAYDEHSHD